MSTGRAATIAGEAQGDAEALVPEREVTAQLMKEREASLYGKGLFPYVTNVVIGTVLVTALGSGAVGAGRRLSWLMTMVLLTLLRIGVWGLHRSRPSLLTARGWLMAFSLGATLNGLLWGSIAVWLWSPSQAHRALLTFVVGGMVAGLTAFVPAYMPAFYAFATASLVPMAVRLLLSGGTMDMTMGVMLAVFSVAMVQLARGAGRWFEQTTELRLRNARLVEHLSESRAKLEQRVRDRTAELERTVEQVRAAEAESRAAVRARNEFLAVASHELRTPLATMELQLSRLERGRDERPWTSRDDDGVAVLRRQVRRLTAQVDTVLTASGLSREDLVLEPREVDLSELVGGVIEDLAAHGRASLSPIELTARRPLSGSWDPARVEQVVAILLSNALKYGGEAPVHVTVDGDEEWAWIRVEDRGPGVDPAIRDRIFDRFFRADAGASTGGLGLGLAVVRELVTAMGGTVTHDESSAPGATFTVRLPRQRGR